MPHANRPQCQFLAMDKKFRAFVGGYGSGKTWIGSMAQCIHFWEHPGINQGYFAPTYPQIRDIFYPTIDEVAFEMGLHVDIKEGNKEVHFYSGRQFRGTTICRSMENPNAIIGFKIGNALVDEFDILPTNKAREAWRKIIARMRYKGDGIRNGIDVTTTPEGFKTTHKLFVEAVQEKPELANNYGIVQASTLENEVNLPPDYIASLYESYTPELVDAYIDGLFVNMTSGTVYRNYNRERCNSNERIQEGEVLHVGQDFNVTKMASTIYVTRPNGWHAVAELKDLFDTPDVIRTLNEKYPKSRKIIYPDASGTGRASVNASVSDISLLEGAGFTVRVDNSNPSVKDRINATNMQFHLGHLHVNARTAPTVAKCFEAQVYDENGEPDKSAGFDHQNDASTYPIAYEFPIVHNHLQRITIGGI